jgi:hypothetical protein
LKRRWGVWPDFVAGMHFLCGTGIPPVSLRKHGRDARATKIQASRGIAISDCHKKWAHPVAGARRDFLANLNFHVARRDTGASPQVSGISPARDARDN